MVRHYTILRAGRLVMCSGQTAISCCLPLSGSAYFLHQVIRNYILALYIASIIQSGAVVIVTSTRPCGSFARAESAVLEATLYTNHSHYDDHKATSIIPQLCEIYLFRKINLQMLTAQRLFCNWNDL